ncbi:MAG: hypothetical protein PUC05_03985, partial [Firmicutes bacterium]|nr:hypothetical protein [Bacillota bacterium]
IWDIINFRRGDIIVGVVPGVHSSELPGQILPAVSEIGVVAEYYNYTGDQSVLEAIHQPLVKYLKLWDFDFNSGAIVTRLCDWYWLDHGDEIDSKILENCWYYSALRFCRKICGIIGAQADEELELRERSIRDSFVKNYLRDDGFRSGDILDDRANAMALLCGFVPQEAMDTVLSVFDSEYRCTPFTEYYLLAALFENGYADRAMKRMRMRYDGMIHNGYSTLWEDFTVTGTYNHAWSGGPLVLLNKYGCGLRPLEPGYKTIGVLPQDIGVRNLQTGVETAQGKVEVQINIDKYFFQVTVIAPEQPVVIGIPADWFGQKEPRLYLNGEAAAFEKNGLHYTVCTGGGFNELMGRK